VTSSTSPRFEKRLQQEGAGKLTTKVAFSNVDAATADQQLASRHPPSWPS